MASNTRIDPNRGPSQPQKSPNDQVVFLGMSPGGREEAAAFAKRTGASVSIIGDTQNNGRITAGGQTHDLSQRSGIDSFTKTLGLNADKQRAVGDAIEGTHVNSRDELANLARVWAPAENGGAIPSRFVLSGESNGDGAWGRGRTNGELTLGDFNRLSQALPNASRQIEDLHLSTCNSGGEHVFDSWKQVLPNAKTMWGYSGSAPGAVSGSAAHLDRWERATRGRAESLDPSIAAKTRKGENISTWTEGNGHRSGQDVVALDDARRAYQGTARDAQRFMSGEEAVADPQTGPLRDHYNNIQTMLRSNALPAAERGPLELERDRTLRGLYYSKTVAPAFATEYRDALAAGYRAAGQTPPDFGALSRRDALSEIKRFEQSAPAQRGPEVERTLQLLRGLRDLDRRVIPNDWVA